MSNVQNAIEEAASRFAHEVVSLLRSATLADILAITGKGGADAGGGAESRGPGRGRGGRRASRNGSASGAEVMQPNEMGDTGGRRTRRAGNRKRSPEEVSRLAERITQFLAGAKSEVGVSAIADGLKVSTADLGLPLQRLRQEGKLKTHGQKRSTVYRLA